MAKKSGLITRKGENHLKIFFKKIWSASGWLPLLWHPRFGPRRLGPGVARSGCPFGCALAMDEQVWLTMAGGGQL